MHFSSRIRFRSALVTKLILNKSNIMFAIDIAGLCANRMCFGDIPVRSEWFHSNGTECVRYTVRTPKAVLQSTAEVIPWLFGQSSLS